MNSLIVCKLYVCCGIHTLHNLLSYKSFELMSLQIASKRKADRNTYGDIIGENASRLKISKKSKVEIGKNKNNRVVFEIQSEQVITIEDDEREEIRGEIQEEIIIVMNDMFSIPLSVLKKVMFINLRF